MLRVGLVVALVALCSAPADAFERGRPMGLYAVSGGASLAMVDSRIEVTVRGPILETVVVQRFRNGSGHATEATYIFPLPADAAVSAMAIQIGGRTIRGAIEGREAAQRRYEAAVAAGVGAGLLEQERADVFTQTVSAIPPGGVVEVTLRYDAVARYEAGSWQLVVPMVVAPRHVPGTASGRATTGSGRAPDTDRAPDASRITPAAQPGAGGSTAVTVHFVDAPAEVKSPTHELGGTPRDAVTSDPRSDHDLVVRWRAAAGSAGWVEREADGGYAAVVVEAPAVAVARKAALRVNVAIDRAATTRGDGDLVERPVVRALLGALERADRVRLLGGDPAWSAPGDVLAGVERRWATPPEAFDLTRVLAAARPEGAAIVLISDGLVADDAAAIAAARRLGVPVHVVGIGPAPARATLQRIAAVTGGTVRYAIAGDDLGGLARAVLGDVATPPAPLTINWGTLGASEVEPAALPRLGAGQAMLIVARIRRAQAANARTRGELFAFEALAPARPVDGAVTVHGPLARRWARERLDDLLAGPHDRGAATSLATSYGLVSPYTSLVAIGSEVVLQGGVKHSVAVPVSLPAGMQWQAVHQAMEADASGSPGADSAAATAPTEAGAGVVAARPITRPAPQPEPAPEATKKSAPRPAAPTPKRSADADGGGLPALSDAERAKLAEQEAKEEVITVTGSTIERKTLTSPAPTTIVDEDARGETIALAGASARRLRLTVALGGGLVFDHGTHPIAALTARIETNRRTALGVEAALWTIEERGTQGRALVTVARRGLAGSFDLGFGLGVQVGRDVGLATALRLRVGTPVRWLGAYLRYDAAALLTRPSLEAEHVVTLGVELSY